MMLKVGLSILALSCVVHAACIVDHAIDIVWLLDASNDTRAESRIYENVVDVLKQFTSRLVMGPANVRQSLAQFAGPLDESISTSNKQYLNIPSYFDFSRNESISSTSFLGALDKLETHGGSRDVAVAVNFVRKRIFQESHFREGSARVVFVVTSGPPTNSLGHSIGNTGDLQEAFRRITSESNAKVVLIQLMDFEKYSDLNSEVHSIIRTTLDTLNQDFLGSLAICNILKDTSNLPNARSLLTRSLIEDQVCHPLQLENGVSNVGQICVSHGYSNLTVAYEVLPNWTLSFSALWAGGNPTTIPLRPSGGLHSTQFPYQGAAVQIPYSAFEVGADCHVYFLPHVRVSFKPADGPVSGEEPVDAFAGEVRFHEASEARVFRTLLKECVSEAPTRSPTSSPTLPPSPRAVPRTFDISLQYLTSFSSQEKQLISAPVTRMQGLFSNDYATSTCFEKGETWCGYKFPERVCVDDLLILVSRGKVDGKNGRFAFSGPCVVSEQLEQVRVGQIIFDEEDLSSIINDSQFESVVMHQVMHVMGFGARWEVWGVVSSSTPLRYTGKSGVQGFQQIGGAPSDLPDLSEDGFHWEDSLFDNELMTSEFNNPDGLRPMSRMTLSSLKDMGFSVDVTRADKFQLVSSGRRRLASSAPLQQRSLEAASDVQIVPLESAKWTVKPGREADLENELAFARENFKTKEPTPEPGSSSDVGVIIGAVIGTLVLLVILLFIGRFWWSYRKNRKAKADKKSLEKSFKNVSKGPQANWSERTDADGRTYWLNEETGEFSWTPPESFNRILEREPSNSTVPTISSSYRRAIRTEGGDKWSEMTDDTGATYWINEESGEFSWVAPTGYTPRKSRIESPIVSKTSSRFPSSSPPSMIDTQLDDSSAGHAVVAMQPTSPQSAVETDEESQLSPNRFVESYNNHEVSEIQIESAAPVEYSRYEDDQQQIDLEEGEQQRYYGEADQTFYRAEEKQTYYGETDHTYHTEEKQAYNGEDDQTYHAVDQQQTFQAEENEQTFQVEEESGFPTEEEYVSMQESSLHQSAYSHDGDYSHLTESLPNFSARSRWDYN